MTSPYPAALPRFVTSCNDHTHFDLKSHSRCSLPALSPPTRPFRQASTTTASFSATRMPLSRPFAYRMRSLGRFSRITAPHRITARLPDTGNTFLPWPARLAQAHRALAGTSRATQRLIRRRQATGNTATAPTGTVLTSLEQRSGRPSCPAIHRCKRLHQSTTAWRPKQGLLSTTCTVRRATTSEEPEHTHFPLLLDNPP